LYFIFIGLSSEEHVEKFRLISNELEVRFEEYRTRAELIKKELETELSNSKTLLDTSVNDLSKVRQAHLSTIKEIEESHELINKTTADKNEAVLSITNELTITKENSMQAIRQMEQLKSDIVEKQNKAKISYQNYERELQLHAKAESSLREKEDELDLIKEKLSNIEQTCANLSTESIIKEKSIHEIKKISDATVEYWREKVNILNSTNEVLEKEIKRLELKSMNANSCNISAATDGSDSSLTSPSSDIPSVAIDTTLDSVLTPEEIMELKKTNIELHQVVKFLNEKERFMKKEHDMKVFECNNLDNELNRSKSSYNSLVRKYDEIKIEIQNERNNLNVDVNIDNFNKIKLELKENQDIINSTREFNQLLRSNNEELTSKNNNLENSLTDLKQLNAPNEKKIRQLLINKKQLEEDKLKLMDKIEVDHQRVKRLLTNFNEIDPDVHKLLQIKYDETSVLFENSKQVNDTLIKEKDSLIEENKNLITKHDLLKQNDKREFDKFKEEKESKQKEVEELTNSKQLIENNAESLRDKCRQFSTKIKDLTQAKNLEVSKNKTLSAEIEELKSSKPSQKQVSKASGVKKTVVAAKTTSVVKAPPVDIVATTTSESTTAPIAVSNNPVSLKRPASGLVTTPATKPSPISTPSNTIASTTVVTEKEDSSKSTLQLKKKSKVIVEKSLAVIANVITEQPTEPVVTDPITDPVVATKLNVTEVDAVITSNNADTTTTATHDEKLSTDVTAVEGSNAVNSSVEMISSDDVEVEVVNTTEDNTPPITNTEIVEEEVVLEKIDEEKIRELIKQKMLQKTSQSSLTPAETATTIPPVIVSETPPVKSMEDFLKEKLLLKKKNLLQQQSDAKKASGNASATTVTTLSTSVKRNASEMIDVEDESKKMKPVSDNDTTTTNTPVNSNTASILGAKPAVAVNTTIAGIFGSKSPTPTIPPTPTFGSGSSLYGNKNSSSTPSTNSGNVIYVTTEPVPASLVPVIETIIENTTENTTGTTVIDINGNDKEDGEVSMKETNDVIIDESIVNIGNENDDEISLLLMEEDNNDDVNTLEEVVDENDIDMEEVTEELQEDNKLPNSAFANIKPPSQITIIPVIGNGKVGKLSVPALLQPNTTKSFLNANAPVFKSINTSSSLFNKSLSTSASNDSLSTIVPPSPTTSPRVSIFNNNNVGAATGLFKSFSSSDLNKSEEYPKITLLSSYNKNNQLSAPFTIGKNKVKEVVTEEEVVNNEHNNVEISIDNTNDITDKLDDDIAMNEIEDNEDVIVTEVGNDIDGDDNKDIDEEDLVIIEESSVVDVEIPVEESAVEEILITPVIEEKRVVRNTRSNKYFSIYYFSIH
jgi:hypothetical protein